MQTSFVCFLGNKVVLKAFFKIDAEELMFGKALAMAAEILVEDAAKAANLTTFVAEATDITTPIYKVNLAKTAPNRRILVRLSQGNPHGVPKRGRVHSVARKGILPKIAVTFKAMCHYCVEKRTFGIRVF